MHAISEHDVFLFVAALGLIILVARFVGELSRRLGQPVLVGEVLAGVILGPSIFGKFLPDLHHYLFPVHGPQSILLQGFSWLCVIFLLLMTGLEIDTAESIKTGKQNIWTALLGFIFPFIAIFFVVSLLPTNYYLEGVDPLHFKLMFGVALSVVAIPVISKILFDLKIMRSNVGLNIITSGVISDIFGWALIAVIVSLITKGSFSVFEAIKPLVVIVIFFGVAMTLGKWLVDKIFQWFHIAADEATSVISLLFAGALINGAIAHMFGIHVIFGALIAGIMVGESKYLTPHVRRTTEDFIFAVFAPIFFVLVGMQLDFSTGINWGIFALLMVVSSIFKISGGYVGAVLGGIGQRNALAVGCGLNTQGTMGVIVGLIGMEMGIFSQPAFSMIVLVCVSTSILVGPLLKWASNLVKRPLAQYFDADHVFLDVEGDTKEKVIIEMVKLMAQRGIIKDKLVLKQHIMERENTLSTAIGDGIALPHARISNYNDTVLCFFRLKEPVAYGAPDKKPVQLLFLEITDENDHGMQLNLISQVARLIASPENRHKLLTCKKAEDVHSVMSFDEKL